MTRIRTARKHAFEKTQEIDFGKSHSHTRQVTVRIRTNIEQIVAD
jgi:hypothetical protein